MAIGSIGLLGRLGALVGQPAVQAVVAGALTGAVGGTALIGTGIVPIGTSHETAPTLALVSCPGSSTVLGRVTTGQPLLVTARSRDGQWLQVYIGAPGLDRAWAPATSVSLQSSGDTLPVADCSAPATPLATLAAPSPAPTPAVSAVASPTAGPTASPTASPLPTPTLAPGQTPPPTPKPTPTAKPTAPPTPPPTAPPTSPPTPKPTLAPISMTGLSSQYQCIGDGGMSTISVTVTDPVGISSVSIGISPPGAFPELFDMTRNKFNTNQWLYTVTGQVSWDPTNQGGWVHYDVTAYGNDGGTRSQSSADDNSTNSLYFMHAGCIF